MLRRALRAASRFAAFGSFAMSVGAGLSVGLVPVSSATARPAPTSVNNVPAVSITVAVRPPLHTWGSAIYDSTGKKVRLAAVNWYGAETPEYAVGGLDRHSLSWFAAWIKANGFNAVRIPFSNELWETNPRVQAKYLSANKGLIGMHARAVLDQVVRALGADGVMVVLDDHTTIAKWCCNVDDGNGLWYGRRWDGGQFTEADWIRDWVQVAKYYAGDPWVVGVELRNEPRTDAGGTPYWGDPAPRDCTGASAADRNDWPEAATCAGNAVLAMDRKLLVIVDGVNFSTDLSGVAAYPVQLEASGRLVYAAHSYSWEDAGLVNSGLGSYSSFEQGVQRDWGYIAADDEAPVWVSEFGTCLQGTGCPYEGELYFAYMRRYLGDTGLSWAYWALNGTKSIGADLSQPRVDQAPETYGLLNPVWSGPSNPSALFDLRQLQSPTTICTFSQTCYPTPLESSPGGTLTVPLPATEGLYVVCVSHGPAYDGNNLWEYVNWTSTYHWDHAGYVPDALINTYHSPDLFWRRCSASN